MAFRFNYCNYTEMEIFLATMEDELQKHFDRECTFQMLHEIAQNHVENARERIGTLNELAESLFVSIATGDLTNGKCTTNLTNGKCTGLVC